MTKITIKFFLYFLIILIISIFYLSYFGIKTEKFNNIIKDQILKKNEKINVNLKDIKILLNLKKISFNLITKNPEIIYNRNKISFNKITTTFALKNFFLKNFTLDNVNILTKETKIEDIIKIYSSFKNTPEIFILKKIIKDGYLLADINLNFDGEGKIKQDYQISGYVKKSTLKLLNKKLINNLNFNYQINYKNYLLSNLNFNFNELKILSQSINIKNKEKYFLIDGNLKNDRTKISAQLVSLFTESSIQNFSNIDISSKNNFQFKVNRQFKIKDLEVKSNIILNKANYKKDLPKLKEYLPKFNNFVELENHKIDLIIKKKKLFIKGKGNLSFDRTKEIIEYKLEKFNDNFNFKSLVTLNNNPITINFLNYKKKNNTKATLEFEGRFIKNKKIFIKNIKFIENKNKFIFKNLNLSEHFKINSVDKINLFFKNKQKQKTVINLTKDKKNYKIVGKSFDASKIIESFFNDKNEKESSSIFNNLNTTVNVDIDKTYLNNLSFINELSGFIIYKNNKINKLDLKSTFPNNKKLTLTINTSMNNEKITTLFSGYPKPFVDQYKFIKGFEDGILDFQSISKDDISNSVLKIDNFKVKEVPALAKLLSLASLQGIADLLTGEGIRFTDFEMIFSNNKNLMTIKELYAIGPAISIMVDGYISNKKLISLRGTLVPARTINRTIASIPIIGDLLVGKKPGEGIFGVSFKVKGIPKDLKTSVNPIKTLTPRFITRTLEKIKKTKLN